MKKSTFEETNEARWAEVDALLKAMKTKSAGTESSRLPSLFRQVCSDLSLAQHRMYGRRLCDRLNNLVVSCYHQLHRGAAISSEGIVGFVTQKFPQAIRREWKLFTLALALFWIPFGAMIAAAYFAPQWIFSMLGPDELSMLDQMYGEGSKPLDHFSKEYGDAGAHFMMFSFYVQHNIGIGLKMFGMGILFTIGSVYELVWEGLQLGAMFGYIHYTGHGENIWRFAIGHSSFELTGLIICGTAGMRLGLGAMFPGRLTRGQAIAASGQRALPLLLGGAGMVFLAAIVEGFWSSQGTLTDEIRYIFGGSMWCLWALYFIFAGRSQERSLRHAA